MSVEKPVSNLATLLAEIQALKLLLIIVVSATKDRDELVATYLTQLEKLETLALFESEIPDELREAIVLFGKRIAQAIQQRQSSESGG